MLNCFKTSRLCEHRRCSFAESAFLARYNTSEAALKVMSIGCMPADSFAFGRYSPIRSAKSRSDVKTGYNIHVASRALLNDDQFMKSHNGLSYYCTTHARSIFIDIIKNQHEPLTAIKMSRRINKSRISILRHILLVTRRNCASDSFCYSISSFFALSLAKSSIALILYDSLLLLIGSRPAKVRLLLENPPRALFMRVFLKKLEKVDVSLHVNRICLTESSSLSVSKN